MRSLLFFVVVLMSTMASAQVPGFMGKRFGLFLEANPTPAFFVQNTNNRATILPGDNPRIQHTNPLAFNLRPQITVEYLVGRDVSIGLSYSMLRMGTARGYKTDPDDTEWSVDPDVVKGQAIGLHLKHYQFKHSASLAPIGFYRTYSIYLTQTNTFDTKKSTTKQFKNDFVYPVATMGFGRQSMISKHFVFKTGVEAGWAFVPSNFFQETPYDWDEQEYAGYNVHQSLAGYYIFSINLAVGYIF